MKGKTCLVTGGSSGIGKATALALAKMGAEVFIVNRNPARGKAALADIRAKSRNDAVHLMLADLSSQDEIFRLVDEFKMKHTQLHVLVNVAGILSKKRQLSVDGLEMNLALNYLAYILLTNLLLDMLKKNAPARIVNVTSVAHRLGRINFDDLQSEKGYNMFTAYGKAKLADILFTRELARRLNGTGVIPNAVHPGLVATRIIEHVADISIAYRVADLILLTPAEGAETVVHLASSPEVNGVRGEYFVRKRIASSSYESKDMDLARRLWEVSEQLTGLSN